MAGGEDGWTPVRSKRRARRGGGARPALPRARAAGAAGGRDGQDGEDAAAMDATRADQWTQGPLLAARSALESNAFADGMATALAGAGNGPCERIVCLGLGHVWTKAGTRQLALLETLRADATVAKPGALVIAADPAFDERDKAVLAALRIDVPPTMELADKAHATNGQRTLYFMPHCPAVLYNNVLWANWSQKALCDALIVGNRLVSYLDDGRELPEDCECLRKLAHRARVLAPQLGKALEVNSLFELAFCDMLPHAFFSEDLDLKLFDDIPAPARFD